MFTKILIADRGDDKREALGAAEPNRLAREAHSGDFTAETKHV
jgi:hypothetical protein